MKGIDLNLNAQIHNHVQNTKNKKLSHPRTSQYCCSVDCVAGKLSHQNQAVTNCDAAFAVDGPCMNQTTFCHVDGPEIVTPAAADDGPCENQTIFCHVDELNIVTHWIQHGLSRDETERPRSARVPPQTTTIVLNLIRLNVVATIPGQHPNNMTTLATFCLKTPLLLYLTVLCIN